MSGAANEPTALVLAGGGSFGAVQVGMLRELVAHGVAPDLVVGSSVGAINAAYFAGAPNARGVAQLEAIWRALSRSEIFPLTWRSVAGLLSRRDFVALSVGAGLVAAGGSASAAGLPVVETDVQVKTPDGTCDAVFIRPMTGSYPGVLIWPDAFGLRPSMRDIGKRIAAEGYSVLVPNPFYRVAKAPVFQDPSSFNFQNPTDRAKLQPLTASINAPGMRSFVSPPLSSQRRVCSAVRSISSPAREKS